MVIFIMCVQFKGVAKHRQRTWFFGAEHQHRNTQVRSADDTGNKMSFDVPAAESKFDHIPHLSFLCPLFLGSHVRQFSPSNTHSLIYFLPRSCVPPASLSTTSHLPVVLQGAHVLPSLFSHRVSSQQGSPPPPPAAPSCQVVESPSEAAVAAGIPCWQRAPPGFTQRTKTQSLLVRVRLRSSSDNIATNYNFASSLNQFPLFPMKRAGSSEVPPSGM